MAGGPKLAAGPMGIREFLDNRQRAAANLFDYLLAGGVADTRRMPASIVEEAPKRTLFRYRPTSEAPPEGPPILLVPPLAAPATCFDLRRGCSLAQHLLSRRRPTYLVDYGPISLSDKDLGLEHWIDEIVPRAIERASEDAGGEPVQVVGWCLGGIMASLAVASHDLPVSAIAMVASPFDFTKVRLLNPIRQLGEVTDGRIVGGAIRAIGQAPATLVESAFKLSSATAYVKKPLTVLRRRTDREFLAHIEAVDALMGDMYAYPGRTMNQLYHRFFRVNELAEGTLTIGGRTVDLAQIRVPLLNVAGESDALVPVAAAHHLAQVAPNAPAVALRTAPGGHLGVLTGTKAGVTTWPMIDEFLAPSAPRR
jgi:polyhydroxyalkanoate synthase